MALELCLYDYMREKVVVSDLGQVRPVCTTRWDNSVLGRGGVLYDQAGPG